jgi:tRNA (guanine37-N1)-methyltransferase
MFTPLSYSIIDRAVKSNLVELHIHNLRDFAEDNHKSVDDAPYGGGSGMVMTVPILYKAVEFIKKQNPNAPVYLTSPQGKVLTQQMCREFSKLEGMILVCAHYEGVDERFIELACDGEISIGNYILTGGELPAMVIADSTIRLIQGVIDSQSAFEESFTDDRLDYPQYTRPLEFMGLKVPEILLSGNHEKIKKWRELQKTTNTLKKRPELLVKKHIKNL